MQGGRPQLGDANQPAAAPPLTLHVGLVGYPNAGKSELTNRLVGSKVTAVSSKRNTTVEVHLGAFTQGRTQVVLFDTPGIVQPKDLKYQGQEARVKSAWQTAADCDLLLLLVDAERQVARKLYACTPDHVAPGSPAAACMHA